MTTILAVLLTACVDYAIQGGDAPPGDVSPGEQSADVTLHPEVPLACDVDVTEAERHDAVATCDSDPEPWSGLVVRELLATSEINGLGGLGWGFVVPGEGGHGRYLGVAEVGTGTTTRGIAEVYPSPSVIVVPGFSRTLDEAPAAHLVDGLVQLGVLSQPGGEGCDGSDCDRVLALAAEAVGRVAEVEVATTAGDTGLSAAWGGQPAWLLDGELWVEGTSESLSLLPTQSEAGILEDGTSQLVDLDGDTRPEFLAPGGVCFLEPVSCRPWQGPDGEELAARDFAVLGDGDEPAILGVTTSGWFVAGPSGAVTTSVIDEDLHGMHAAVASIDTDGDGRAEACIAGGKSGLIVSDEGAVLATLGPDGAGNWSGCIAADLDADGDGEFILAGTRSVRVHDGLDGDWLARLEPGVEAGGNYGLVVAELDGEPGQELALHGLADGEPVVAVIGPATGEWSRGRPVWNQHAYDITSIHDDGTLAPFPRPPWQSYNAHRAQPAHDGDRPDLVPELVDVCADSCAAGGTILASARVANLGGEPSAGGAELRLHALHGDQWVQVASASLGGTIDEGTTTATVLLEFPYEQRGTRHVLEVVAAPGEDECDMVNDRVEVQISPCGE